MWAKRHPNSLRCADQGCFFSFFFFFFSSAFFFFLFFFVFGGFGVGIVRFFACWCLFLGA